MKNYSVSSVQQSNTYPIYQLWMFDDSSKVSEDDKFKICVLTVLEWLRDKIKDANDTVPDELNYSSPKEYTSVNLSGIRSCTYHNGYEIDTISLTDDRIFVASFLETDTVTEKDKDGIGYDHYAGRKVKTEYAVKLINHRLEIGIRVLFSDGIGIDAYSTPKRPSIVKRLIENPDLSFKQTTPITKEVFSLKNSNLIDLLKNNLSSEKCGLHAVVLIEKDYTVQSSPVIDTRLLSTKPVLDKPVLIADARKKLMEGSEKKPSAFQQKADIRSVREPSKKESLSKVIPDPIPSFIKTEKDIRLPIRQYKEIAKSGYGYAVFYELKLHMLEEFNRQFSISANPGECVILQPDNFGGKTFIKKNSELENVEGGFYDTSFGREIRDFVRNRKGYYFGNLEFTPGL
ncbi:MAG: hypothetical protein HUJ58_00855, partial [Erysipelotrichaceae bacterium]|nr:hypothetical protein [Erysipelotrichaceae bacterium]